MKKPKIIAVIPAYNEEKAIATVILETEKHVDKIIVVDDGSTDHTAEIARRMGAIVISHPKNMGYGAALITGFKEALKQGADIIVTLDADGQHDPYDIPRLVKPILEEKVDMVIGSRFLAETKMPKYREIGVKTITKISNIAIKTGITDAQSGYRAYKSSSLKKILPLLTEKGMGLSLQLLSKAIQYNFKIKEVPTRISYEVEKPSTKNPLAHGIELITTIIKEISERHPLLYIGLPGIAMIIVGLIAGICLLQIFNSTRYFSLPLAIIAMGATLTGIILATTALTLRAIIEQIKKLKSE